jgi:hypothetical protein
VLSQVRVAPRSHGRVKGDDARLRATRTNPHRSSQTRMNRPPPHLHGKEGVDGSSPSEGFSPSLQASHSCQRSLTGGFGWRVLETIWKPDRRAAIWLQPSFLQRQTKSSWRPCGLPRRALPRTLVGARGSQGGCRGGFNVVTASTPARHELPAASVAVNAPLPSSRGLGCAGSCGRAPRRGVPRCRSCRCRGTR